MSEESIPRSLQYALTRELLRLYAVVLVGWAMMDFSGSVYLGASNSLEGVVQLLLFLVGFFLVMSGVVAVAHRVLSDTVR